jgi:serine/threonine protein kinase
MGDAKGLGF